MAYTQTKVDSVLCINKEMKQGFTQLKRPD